jgi:hypothetical protein
LAYTQYTRLQFITELAQALNDPSFVYWSQDELNRTLNEALLYWGALTSYWTTSSSFDTSTGVPYYDLSVMFPALRSRAYTMGNIMREMQYHLFEPAQGVAGGGAGATAQFDVPQLTNAIIRRRNQLVIDSKVPMSMGSITQSFPITYTVDFGNSVALISRATWTDSATGIVTPLRRTDTFAAKAFKPFWNTNPGKPYGFSQAELMPGKVILIPPAKFAGRIDVTCVTTQALAVADDTILQVPDEFALAVKYGALYEVLSTNSQGYDPIRTKYCLERYSAAVEVAQAHRSILEIRINDKPVSLTTLAAMDAGKPTWGTGTGKPDAAGCAYDILALSKPPDSALYSIMCYLSQTAPLPAVDGDFIQVGREELGYLMDYCRHVSQIKIGGVEFVQSMPLYDSFLAGAKQRSKFLIAKAKYLTPLFSQAAQEEAAHPAA